MPKSKHELLIIAGPNGSGKTTFAKSFLQIYKYEFLNADEIANELSSGGNKASNIAAGKEYFNRLRKLIDKKKNLVIESTLSGLFLKKWLNEIKKAGYSITLIYVFLNDADTCIERIKIRVSKGGHFVSDDDVIRRYERSKNNFWNTYKSICDSWYLYNNSEQIILVASGIKGKVSISDELLLNKFKLNKNEIQ